MSKGQHPFRYPVEVRFRDVDLMGHAHHSLPLIYFEEARAAYWREIVGHDEITDIDYILAEATVRYHARIRFPARLIVEARVTRLGGKSFAMAYELRSDAGDRLASGSTTQVMYDYGAARPKPIPHEVRQRIEAYEGTDIGDGAPR